MNILIQHIVVIWDECDHVGKKRGTEISKVFFKYYASAFPDGAKTAESPHVITTSSKIICDKRMTSFLHGGEFVPFQGENKDLAIVKFCTTGVVDQNEEFHYILDDVRYLRHSKNDPALGANNSVLTVFITSDKARGMSSALDHVFKGETKMRSSFMSFQVPKLSGKKHERIKFAGNMLGVELKKRFVHLERDALLLNMV